MTVLLNINIPFISSAIYLLCILGSSMLSLLVTVTVLQCYHRESDRPVPEYIRTLIVIMATITCQNRKCKVFSRIVQEGGRYKNSNKTKNMDNIFVYSHNPTDIKTSIDKHTVQIKNIEDHKKESTERLIEAVISLAGKMGEMVDEMQKMQKNRKEEEGVKKYEAKKNKADQQDNPWRIISHIVDQFFLRFFIGLMVSINLVLFVIMPSL